MPTKFSRYDCDFCQKRCTIVLPTTPVDFRAHMSRKFAIFSRYGNCHRMRRRFLPPCKIMACRAFSTRFAEFRALEPPFERIFSTRMILSSRFCCDFRLPGEFSDLIRLETTFLLEKRNFFSSLLSFFIPFTHVVTGS